MSPPTGVFFTQLHLSIPAQQDPVLDHPSWPMHCRCKGWSDPQKCPLPIFEALSNFYLWPIAPNSLLLYTVIEINDKTQNACSLLLNSMGAVKICTQQFTYSGYCWQLLWLCMGKQFSGGPSITESPIAVVWSASMLMIEIDQVNIENHLINDFTMPTVLILFWKVKPYINQNPVWVYWFSLMP